MFWPVVLPFKFTFWMLAGLVLGATVMAPAFKGKRGRTFLLSTCCALAAFIPSCIGIELIVDQFRFGQFEYLCYDDIHDFRYQRYLPATATNIKMHKHPGGNGYRACYSISEADFQSYLNELWDEYGERSAVQRGGYSDDGRQADLDDFRFKFGDLGWTPWDNPVISHSPSESDGGGATYYFDRDAGTAYQSTGFW